MKYVKSREGFLQEEAFFYKKRFGYLANYYVKGKLSYFEYYGMVINKIKFFPLKKRKSYYVKKKR